MAGAAVKHARVNIGASSASEALEEVGHQFDLKISNARCADFRIDDRSGASTEIHGGQTESFIHGHDKVAGTENAAAVSQGAIEDFAQSDSNVFDSMMLIDIEVADSGKFQIECAVPRKKFQHMIEKTNSRRDFVLSTTLNRERNPNFGFRGLAMELRLSHAVTSMCGFRSRTTWRSAAIRVCVCFSDPTVRRTQPSHPGSVCRSRTRIPRARKA